MMALLALFVMSSAVNSVGLNQVPDIGNSTVTSSAVLVSGPPGSGEYVYNYTINSAPDSVGTIWILEIDYSASFRRPAPSATFPVNDGNNVANVSDLVDLIVPVDGELGEGLLEATQRAPAGWTGGYSKAGYIRFAATGLGAQVVPGVSVSGLETEITRPPTIRRYRLEPDWIFAPADNSEVNQANMEAAFTIEQNMVVTGFTLGPSEPGIGDSIQINTLRKDMVQSESLGWITNPTLLAQLLTILDSAITSLQGGDGNQSVIFVQGLLDVLDAANPSDFNAEFEALVRLNANALIELNTT